MAVYTCLKCGEAKLPGEMANGHSGKCKSCYDQDVITFAELPLLKLLNLL